MRTWILGTTVLLFSLLIATAGEKLPKAFWGYWEVDVDRTLREIEKCPGLSTAEISMMTSEIRALFKTYGDKMWVEINENVILGGTHSSVGGWGQITNVYQIELTNSIGYLVKTVSENSATVACTNDTPLLFQWDPNPQDKVEKRPPPELVLRLVDNHEMTLECAPLRIQKETVWKRVRNSRMPTSATEQLSHGR